MRSCVHQGQSSNFKKKQHRRPRLGGPANQSGFQLEHRDEARASEICTTQPGPGKIRKSEAVQLYDRVNEAQPQSKAGRRTTGPLRSVKASGDEISLRFRDPRASIGDTHDVVVSDAA